MKKVDVSKFLNRRRALRYMGFGDGKGVYILVSCGHVLERCVWRASYGIQGIKCEICTHAQKLKRRNKRENQRKRNPNLIQRGVWQDLLGL